MAEKIVVIASCGERRDLEDLVPPEVLDAARKDMQKAIPSLSKDPLMIQSIEGAIRRFPTSHRLILGDSRHMENIPDESVHLVVTSPPYWTLKEYPLRYGQLGLVEE